MSLLAVTRSLRLVAIGLAAVTLLLLAAVGARAISVPNPVGHWTLDEGSGTWAGDSTAGDHDGVVTGATWEDGVDGSALRLDGDGDRLDIVGDTTFETAHFTVGLWVRASPGQGPAIGSVILEAGAHGCEGTIGLYATETGVELRAHGTANGVAKSLTVDESWYGTDVWDGEWHHVGAAVASFGNISLTIDARTGGLGLGGAIDYVGQDAAGVALGGPLRPATCDTPSFKGDIDDIRFFDAALDRDQIGSLMPPVATSVSIQEVEPIRARLPSDCLQVTVAPPPPGGTVTVELRDEQGDLAKTALAATEWCAWPDPPPAEGTYLVPLDVEWAGDYSAIARFEPGLPWTEAASDPFALTVERRSTQTQVHVNPVMPGHEILVESSVQGGDSDMAGTITLVDTTGDGEAVLATKSVTVSPGSTVGTAQFTLPGRDAGTYTFEARYSGTTELYAPSEAETSTDIDDTLGDRGPVTLGANADYLNKNQIDVYAPAEHATSMRVRGPGAQWLELSYHVPTQYVLGTLGPIPPDGPITIDVQWKDPGDRWSETHSASAILDRTAPTLITPTSTIATTSPSVGAVPTKLTWTANDATAGVAHHELQSSRNGAAFTTVSSSIPIATHTTSLSSGSDYRFRVRTVDAAGNVSGWKTTATMTANQYSEASSRIAYRGAWSTARSASHLGGAARWSTSRGATATFTFTGRAISWIAAKGPTRGSADVFVNGTLVRT